MAKSADNLKAWHLADRLVLLTYQAIKLYPSFERYGLSSQMCRAAISVPVKITEGAARKSRQDFLQCLSIASSSLSELGYYVHLSRRLGYLSEHHHRELEGLHQETGRTLQGLMTKVASDLTKKNTTG